MSVDIVPRLRCWLVGCCRDSDIGRDLSEAADEIEQLRDLIDKWTDLCIEQFRETTRLRNELAARCGDARPGAHTAGPSETFIPEAL